MSKESTSLRCRPGWCPSAASSIRTESRVPRKTELRPRATPTARPGRAAVSQRMARLWEMSLDDILVAASILRNAIRSAARRTRHLQALARGGRLPADAGRRAVYHRHPAAQRDSRAAHGPRPRQRHTGRADPLRADAWPRRAVAAGDRPRRDRDAERGRKAGYRERHDALRDGAGGLFARGGGIWEADGPHHPRAAQSNRQLLRLDAHAFHARSGILARGARSVRAAVGAAADLSRPPGDPLVPPLPHCPLR